MFHIWSVYSIAYLDAFIGNKFYVVIYVNIYIHWRYRKYTYYYTHYYYTHYYYTHYYYTHYLHALDP